MKITQNITNTMKAQFNLSEIMRNAHKLFKSQTEKGAGLRCEVKSFADCLRAAWRAAKSYIGRSISIIWMWGSPTVKVQETAEYAAGVAAEYGRGRYMGD